MKSDHVDPPSKGDAPIPKSEGPAPSPNQAPSDCEAGPAGATRQTGVMPELFNTEQKFHLVNFCCKKS